MANPDQLIVVGVILVAISLVDNLIQPDELLLDMRLDGLLLGFELSGVCFDVLLLMDLGLLLGRLLSFISPHVLLPDRFKRAVGRLVFFPFFAVENLIPHHDALKELLMVLLLDLFLQELLFSAELFLWRLVADSGFFAESIEAKFIIAQLQLHILQLTLALLCNFDGLISRQVVNLDLDLLLMLRDVASVLANACSCIERVRGFALLLHHLIGGHFLLLDVVTFKAFLCLGNGFVLLATDLGFCLCIHVRWGH